MGTWIYSDTDKYDFPFDSSVNNAYCLYDTMILPAFGSWTANAIAGMAGNFMKESFLNPSQWEGGHYEDMSRGFGLGQWTPATKLSTWAEEKGKSWRNNATTQLEYLWATPAQWNSQREPIIDMDLVKFSQSTLDVETLSDYWLHYWEQPTEEQEEETRQERREYAKYFFDLYGGYTPTPSKGKMKWMYWCKPIFY